MTAETSNARGEWVLVPRVPTEAMIDAWRDAPNRWAEAYAAMLAAAPQPPSAPVGVEASYHPCTSILIEGLKRLEGGGDVLAEWDRARAQADAALAQQPAQKGGGEDAPGSRAWMAEVCRAAALSLAAHGVRNDQLSKVADWIAQQPAAVDEAYPTPRNRAEAVALARLALAHLGVIDAHIDVAIARCETALAAPPPADPRAADEQAIAEAFKRMAPDDYKPMPDRPVPMEQEKE